MKLLGPSGSLSLRVLAVAPLSQAVDRFSGYFGSPLPLSPEETPPSSLPPLILDLKPSVEKVSTIPTLLCADLSSMTRFLFAKIFL